MDKPVTTTLRQKFKTNPLRLAELKPLEFSSFKYFWGTYKNFGFTAAFPNVSPLFGFLCQAVRGFPYRDWILAIDESSFTFRDGDTMTQPQVIDGGKK